MYLYCLILSYQENYPWVPIQPHTLAKESLTGIVLSFKKSFICVKRSFKERFICIKLSFRHSVERLRIFLSPHLKKKKMNTATKDPPQSELEPRTPRSRILSLSTWAICDSTKAGGKKTLKYGRAHSASRAAVVWRWTWRSCSSLTVVYPLFSLKGQDNSLV